MIDLLNFLNNEYILSLLIIFGSVVFANIFTFTLRTYIHRLTRKTDTDLDDIALKIISKPINLVIIMIGLNLVLNFLTAVEPYRGIIVKIFFVFYTIIITLTLSKIVNVFVLHWFKVQKKFEKTPRLISKIISVIIFIIALLIILDYFDVAISPLIATLGVGGLAVGLALQNTLSNFFSGLHILSDQPIKVGDFVELQGKSISGFVEDIGWRSIRIKTLSEKLIIIPNSTIAESVITNVSMPNKDSSVKVDCGVSYKTDLKKAEKIALVTAKNLQKKLDYGVSSYDPVLRYKAFGDSNIDFFVILRAVEPGYVSKLRHEYIKVLKEAFDKENIEISWPVVIIHKAKSN